MSTFRDTAASSPKTNAALPTPAAAAWSEVIKTAAERKGLGVEQIVPCHEGGARIVFDRGRRGVSIDSRNTGRIVLTMATAAGRTDAKDWAADGSAVEQACDMACEVLGVAEVQHDEAANTEAA